MKANHYNLRISTNVAFAMGVDAMAADDETMNELLERLRGGHVINPEGVIHWSYVSPVGVNPVAEGILAALKELQNSRRQNEN